jgi:glycosyltransferase involved in cell wall biosynthesis
MKYLICQDWINTSNNHAGMKHMGNLLKKNYPAEYDVEVIPDIISNIYLGRIGNKILRILIRKVIIPFLYYRLGKKLCKKAKGNDQIYLLEYLEKSYPQLLLAKYIKRHHPMIEVKTMVHLVPTNLGNLFSESELKKWLDPVDEIITLGSSLTDFFLSTMRLPQYKVKTLFHYVDLEFYKPLGKAPFNANKNEKVKVIVMGNQKRNFDILEQIVKKNKSVRFTICQGVLNLRPRFSVYENVRIVDFLKEDELLKLMQESDISLNIMDDTVGSNVIVTSMAVGLALIVSDVGSIRNYCGEDGALYCQNDNIDSFLNAIDFLSTNFFELSEFKKKSVNNCKKLSIASLHDRF